MAETAKLDRTNPPKHNQTGPRIYRHVDVPAVATSYDDLVLQLIARRHELGLTQRELDDRAGWADGYTGKVEASPDAAKKNCRRASTDTFALWLTALDVVLIAVPGYGKLSASQLGALSNSARRAQVRAQLIDVALRALLPLGLGLRAVPREAISDDLPAFRIGLPHGRSAAPSSDDM